MYYAESNGSYTNEHMIGIEYRETATISIKFRSKYDLPNKHFCALNCAHSAQ